MAIDDIYSTRNKPIPDVFNYDGLTSKLKNQIVHIWSDFFNMIKNEDTRDEIWDFIENKIAKAHGKQTVLEDSFTRYKESYKVEYYFLNNENIEECLDIIEIVFRVIIESGKHFQIVNYVNESIDDLNKRFLENGIGFQFIQEKVIKIDNTLLHSEITKPTLNLLSQKEYENANEEYLVAHEHFRHKRNKECLNECLKAFESTMKIICTKNNFAYDEKKDTASVLINILITKGFFPNYHQSQLTALRQLLESDIPTIRNKNSGHGQGVNKIIVSDELASYILYVSGATIKLLVDTQNMN